VSEPLVIDDEDVDIDAKSIHVHGDRLGALDEAIQALLPSRVLDPVDILCNALAGVMAVATCAALARTRNRRTPLGSVCRRIVRAACWSSRSAARPR
jgi:hypothetical protein